MIYWGNYYQSIWVGRTWVLLAPIAATVLLVLGFYLMSIGLGEYLDPRKRLVRLTAQVGDETPDDEARKSKDELWAP